MPTTVSVAYPQGVKFDMKYYIDTHMPLVSKNFGPYGVTGWKVIMYPDDAPYKVQALLEVESADGFQKAASGPEAKEVFGDIPNFSDKDPVVWTGSVEGTQ